MIYDEDIVSNYSKEELRIYHIAKSAYDEALAYYYYPSLPEPIMIFDYSRVKGFYIDTQTWEITLNLANIPDILLDKELHDYFFSLSLHEISHYIHCPYDNTTNFKLLAAAIKGGVNKYFAPMVVNIFSDLIIDSKNHEKFSKIMDWELEITTKNILKDKNINEMTPLWKVLVCSYEILWGLQLINKQDIVKDIINASKYVCRTILKDYDDESNWESKVKSISRRLKEILRQSSQFDQKAQVLKQPGKKGSSGNEFGCSENPFKTPDDVNQTFGDLSEVQNPNIIKSGGTGKNKSQGPLKDEFMEGTAEVLASEIDFNTFSDVMSLFGLNDTIQNLGVWYRGIAKDILRIKMFQKKPGRSIPIYPQVWRIGDSIDELDVVQSILASPVIIPNITTRKWSKRQGPGNYVSRKLPDMMLVLDSSGSMDWNFQKKTITGRYHISLIAAFASLQYASKNGCYVSAINFSNKVKFQDWTNNYGLIERNLLRYQGNGTVLPTKIMEELTKKAAVGSMIMIISDLEIQNWGKTLETFNSLLRMKHKLVAFFIDGDPALLERDDFRDLIQKGAKFYCIDKLDDLLGLVITEVEDNYAKES